MDRVILFLLPLSGSFANAYDGARTYPFGSSASDLLTIEKTIIHTTVRKQHDISLTSRNATQGHGASGPAGLPNDILSSRNSVDGMATVFSWPHSSPPEAHDKRSVESSIQQLSEDVSTVHTNITMATIFSWPVPSPTSLGGVIKRSAKFTVHQHDDNTTTMPTASSWPGFSLPTSSPHLKRSANLYALHIPFGDNEGYIDVLLPNITALLFCKSISEELYDDSLKTFHNLYLQIGDAGVVIPVREVQAEEFCQTVKGEKSEDSTKSEKPKDDLDPTTTADGGKKKPTSAAQDGTAVTTSDVEGSATETSAPKPRPSKVNAPTPTKTAVDGVEAKPTMTDEPTTSLSSTNDILSGTGLGSRRSKEAASSTPTKTPIAHDDSIGDGDASQTLVPEKGYNVQSESTEGSIASTEKTGDGTLALTSARQAHIKAAGATTLPSSQDATTTPPSTGSNMNTWADYIKSYMDNATPTEMHKRSVPTGLASPRVSANAAVPRPNRLGILTQLVRRRPRNVEPADDTVEADSRENGVMPQDPDDMFVAPQKSTSSTPPPPSTTADTLPTSSARVPAKARPGATADPTDMPSATPISRRPHSTATPTSLPEDQPFNDPNLLDEIGAGNGPTTTRTATAQDSSVAINKKPKPAPTDDAHAGSSPNVPIPKSPPGSKQASNSSSDANGTGRYYQTSWGQTAYPEMRASLYVLWGIVGLQVLCGLHEFSRSAWGEWDLGIRG